MLKPAGQPPRSERGCQPPSGGCVLKRLIRKVARLGVCPAAFGRLCVETMKYCRACLPLAQPPSGGCVLKLFFGRVLQICSIQPPSGGCVLKQSQNGMGERHRKPAAFGRLCVETMPFRAFLNTSIPSRLRAAVC